MILRRLSQSLKEQNWTAIIIEFVLLVTGVFLGIQVSNWNAERATRQKSAIFTARLMTDLRVEAWAYQYLIEYQRDVQANARRALDGFDGSQPLSDEQLVIAAYRATQYESQDRHRATYDELVSTGTIGLITNQKMRDTAMMVYATTLIDQTLDEGKQSEYRLIFRRTLPAQVQQALLERCGDKIITPLDYAGIVHSLDYPVHAGPARGNRQRRGAGPANARRTGASAAASLCRHRDGAVQPAGLQQRPGEQPA